MVPQHPLRNALFSRDVAVAYAIIVAMYFLKFIPFQPLQIPPYLLIVAYDLVEIALPFLTPYYPVVFPVFLYVLAVGSVGITRKLRSTGSEQSPWVEGLGGVCLLVGLLSFGFGAFVGGPLFSPTDNPTPLATTATTGTVLLVFAWWLLGRPTIRSLIPV